jgi:hypothetical protein
MKGAFVVMKHIRMQVTVCLAKIRAISIRFAMVFSNSWSRSSFELADLLDFTGCCVLQKRALPGVGEADYHGR